MTVIELLCVIAIIMLLAALLLPAVGQAKTRARRIQCIDHLHEAGLGFISYANDHNGQFPMAVPTSAGGTLEFARSGNLLGGDFYFSFRHFQAVSNELVTPKLVVCPADTRPPADNFAALSNANLSYFIGVNAEFARPSSILAGDRNLTNDFTTPSTIVRLGPNYALRWTEELHRFKGDLLFSDGHVEQKNNSSLTSAAGQVPAVATLSLPTVRRPGAGSSSGGAESSPSARWPSFKPETGTVSGIRFPSALAAKPGWGSADTGTTGKLPAPPKAERKSTNAVPTPASPKPEEPAVTLSPFTLWLAAITGRMLNNGVSWFYALLLLVVAAVLFARRLARGRNQPPPKRPTKLR
jgi:type II secretory pathway pseudopilin PulG